MISPRSSLVKLLVAVSVSFGAIALNATEASANKLKKNTIRYKDTSATPAKGNASNGLQGGALAFQNSPSELAKVTVSSGACGNGFCWSIGTVDKVQLKAYAGCTITSTDLFAQGSTGATSGKLVFTSDTTYSDYNGSRDLTDYRLRAGMGLQVDLKVRDAGSARTANISLQTCVLKGPDAAITLDPVDTRTTALASTIISARVRETNGAKGALGHCVFYEDGEEIGRNEWVYANRGSEVSCGLMHFFRTAGPKNLRADWVVPQYETDWDPTNNSSSRQLNILPAVLGSSQHNNVSASVSDMTFFSSNTYHSYTYQDYLTFGDWYDQHYLFINDNYGSNISTGREQRINYFAETPAIAFPLTAGATERSDGVVQLSSSGIVLEAVANGVYRDWWTNWQIISNSYGYGNDANGGFYNASNMLIKDPDTGVTTGSGTITYGRLAGDVTYFNYSRIAGTFYNPTGNPALNYDNLVYENSGYFENHNGTYIPLGATHTIEVSMVDAAGNASSGQASVTVQPTSSTTSSSNYGVVEADPFWNPNGCDSYWGWEPAHHGWYCYSSYDSRSGVQGSF